MCGHIHWREIEFVLQDRSIEQRNASAFLLFFFFVTFWGLLISKRTTELAPLTITTAIILGLTLPPCYLHRAIHSCALGSAVTDTFEALPRFPKTHGTLNESQPRQDAATSHVSKTSAEFGNLNTGSLGVRTCKLQGRPVVGFSNFMLLLSKMNYKQVALQRYVGGFDRVSSLIVIILTQPHDAFDDHLSDLHHRRQS